LSTNGNGTWIETPAEAQARTLDTLRSVLPRTTADLSSRERSELMDRTVQQVRNLTAANNALNARLLTAEREHHGLLQWVVKVANEQNAQGRRLDTIERLSAARSYSFLARLRWILTGR
jgi:hypothetical protein